MKYLLDTHAFLWFVADDNKISSKAKSVIEDSKNEIYFSAASAWEKDQIKQVENQGGFRIIYYRTVINK